jgi:hypothetical protein
MGLLHKDRIFRLDRVPSVFKGTGSPDGLGFSWHVWIDLCLKKGGRWFLNVVGAPAIIH